MDTSRREQATDLLIHDIRTPLAAISGYAQLLLRRTVAGSSDPSSLDDGLHRIQEAATRAAHLLDQLTDASLSLEEHIPHTAHAPELVDLVQLVQCMADESQTAARAPAHVVVLPSVAELVGWWDPTCLERVVGNLIDNALKYNRLDQSILVSIQSVNNWAVITVADRGLGIPSAELPRIFEPGYRATNVSRRSRGSGLGLAGVRQIVARLGGSISLDSRLGLGTTATVRFPLGGITP
jgi:signal transduction histidine kinase